MIQIPGIKYGVKDVVALATLNAAVEDILETLENAGLTSLEAQSDFLAQCLAAWFDATGRFEEPKKAKTQALDPENVTYQGRVLVSVLALMPAVIWKLKQQKVPVISDDAAEVLTKWFRGIAQRGNLLERGVFIGKSKFKKRGYLGSGGIGRFRDILWAASLAKKKLGRLKPETIGRIAEQNQDTVFAALI